MGSRRSFSPPVISVLSTSSVLLGPSYESFPHNSCLAEPDFHALSLITRAALHKNNVWGKNASLFSEKTSKWTWYACQFVASCEL